MPAVYEIAPAKVHPDVHVGGTLGEAEVVESNVGGEEGVRGLGIEGVGFPSGEHLFRAEICAWGI